MIIITFALTGRHCIMLRITQGVASLAQGYGQSLGFQPALGSDIPSLFNVKENLLFSVI